MRAGLLLVDEIQEMGDVVAVVHGFVAGVAAILAARPGDDGVFHIGPIQHHGFAFWARGSSILRLGGLRQKEYLKSIGCLYACLLISDAIYRLRRKGGL
jgi:hypothetical protein